MTALDQSLKQGDRELIAPGGALLLLDGTAWIHRRREAVEILDETAIKRQISVDFTLPTELPDAVMLAKLDDLGYAAPVYVLPKTLPSNLMSFDLKDSTGGSMPLMTKAENKEISADLLVQMATRVCGQAPVEDLARRLREVAITEAPDAEAKAENLLNEDAVATSQLGRLMSHDRFRWWLFTFAHSSVVVVWVTELGSRQIVKLSFRGPITSDLSPLGRLGWSPYQLMVDSSYVEARTHHFEAESPAGLRIVEAQMGTDHSGPESDAGFMRRVHLYASEAAQAGGATVKLHLRVSADGFIRSAWLPALLITVAFLGAAIRHDEIAQNPTSAPALLLLLPGLVATYIGRPDHHALTSRLLAAARWALLFSALFAYLAAGYLASLGPVPAAEQVDLLEARQDEVELVMKIAASVSAVPFLLLLVSLVRAGPRSEWLSWLGRPAAKPAGWLSQRLRRLRYSWRGLLSVIRKQTFQLDLLTDCQLKQTSETLQAHTFLEESAPRELRHRPDARAIRPNIVAELRRSQEGARSTTRVKITAETYGAALVPDLIAGLWLAVLYVRLRWSMAKQLPAAGRRM